MFSAVYYTRFPPPSPYLERFENLNKYLFSIKLCVTAAKQSRKVRKGGGEVKKRGERHCWLVNKSGFFLHLSLSHLFSFSLFLSFIFSSSSLFLFLTFFISPSFFFVFVSRLLSIWLFSSEVDSVEGSQPRGWKFEPVVP